MQSNQAKELYQALLALESEDECRRFLRDLLTEEEIKEFSNRWKVARMLGAKLSYKAIEKETGMSSTTIARIQKWLLNGMGGYQLMLNRMKRTEKRLKNTNHHATPAS